MALVEGRLLEKAFLMKIKTFLHYSHLEMGGISQQNFKLQY